MNCGRENHSTRLRRDSVSTGNSLGQFASAGLREKQRDISALPLRSRSRKEEQWKRSDHWKGGCFYTASGIMGSPLLPPIPKLLEKNDLSRVDPGDGHQPLATPKKI
ncbi:hypothetical protein ILYODFUR_030752, partial [Ilyodon furcidens]